jgi:hypothetical protein
VSGSPIKRRTEVKNTLPIGRIEGSKTPIETHTPLIRYFINDIDPKRTRLPDFMRPALPDKSIPGGHEI